MNLQTFRAPTMAECLSEVKRTMGADAVILHTRTYVIRKWLGFKRREMVEITAGRGLTNGPRGRRQVKPAFVEVPPPTYKPIVWLPCGPMESSRINSVAALI